MWKLTRSILRQINKLSDDDIKRNHLDRDELIEIKNSIKEQSEELKPSLVDLAKYEIKHIKD